MKLFYGVALLISIALVGFIVYYYPPKRGWSNIFGECKYCSSCHKHTTKQPAISIDTKQLSDMVSEAIDEVKVE